MYCITMHNPPLRYNALMIANFIDYGAFTDTRDNLMFNVIENGEFTNKYTMIGDLQSPNAELFIAPIYKTDINTIRQNLETSVKGIETNTMIITDVIVGRLSYRMFDNTYSLQNLTLEHFKKKNISEKIDYY